MQEYSQILTRLGVIDTRLESIEKHMEKQNGRLEKSEGKLDDVDRRLVGMETRCVVVNHQGERDHARMEAESRENRSRIAEILKQSGTWLLSLLMVLNMLGSWLGWW